MNEQRTRPGVDERGLEMLAIPQVLLFGGMAVMLIVHPNAVTSGLHSTRALAVNALTKPVNVAVGVSAPVTGVSVSQCESV